MMKRALSVVLALVMLASLLVAPVSAVKAKPMERIREEEGSSARRNPSVPLRDVQAATGENLDEFEDIDIYFVNETDLGSVYVNYYPQEDPPEEVDSNEELDFQGIEKDGHNYYKITLNTELYDCIFFHDGQNGGYESGHQTEELQFIRDAWDDPLDENGNRYVVYYVYREDGKLNVNERINDVWPQEKQYTTPPTCTEPGAKAYVGLRTGVPQEEEPVSALGHLPGEPVKENVTAPTETSEGGYDMVVYCQRCGIELSREHTVLPALDLVDLYFVDQDDNAEGWVYAFGNSNENDAFPGVQMTAVGVDEHGDNWYKVT
ncbi:MAG: hypothetical protein IKQ54_11210, partial [Oscillospiraceae bacterium]|nr:hypothetical protein [Oscillospiraceae bacterium]